MRKIKEVLRLRDSLQNTPPLLGGDLGDFEGNFEGDTF